MSRFRQRLADAHRARLLARNARIDTTPPPPQAFGAFGDASRIVPPARVTAPGSIHIGDRVEIGAHAWLSVAAAVDGVVPRLVIGSGTRIAPYSHIACVGDMEIGADVVFGERVFVADTYHCYEDVAIPVRDQPLAHPLAVRIGNGVRLGAGSIVLLGVTIGDDAQVDAGAVVTADVPAGGRVAGNPARATD